LGAGDCATIYQHKDFKGISASFGPGFYNIHELGAMPNDQVSSLKVGATCKATLYEHANFRGVSVLFKPGNYAWIPNQGFPNDKLSAIVVQRTCSQFKGIYNGGIACCKASCGKCGGLGCSRRPGGASGCCQQHITRNGKVCSRNVMAPCNLE